MGPVRGPRDSISGGGSTKEFTVSQSLLLQMAQEQANREAELQELGGVAEKDKREKETGSKKKGRKSSAGRKGSAERKRSPSGGRKQSGGRSPKRGKKKGTSPEPRTPTPGKMF